MLSDELFGEVQLAGDVHWLHLILEVDLCHLKHLGFVFYISSVF